MTDREDDGTPYAVGYGHPPLHSRFGKGQSGNRRGRPRRAQTPADVAAAILDEKLNVSVNGAKQRLPVQTAILMRLREQALKGDLRSARYLLELRAGGGEGVGAATASILSDEDRAILAMAGLGSNTGEDRDGEA